jgi:predicted dehydrogenase
MNKSAKIGVIGCGKQAIKHVPALQKFGCEVVLADLDEEVACRLADEFGLKYVASPEEVFGDESIAAVSICTPTPSHFPLIKNALRAGKHFFCEKPLASTSQEAKAIQEKVEKTDLVGMVGYLYRFHPAFQLVRDLILDGTVGRPYFASFRLGGRGSHRIWKHEKDKGGGAVNEMMVHMLDLVLWYFGKISRTRTILLDTVLTEREVEGKIIQADAEDLAIVHLETESGVKVICESDLITPSYMNYLEIQATNGSILTSILDYIPSLVFCKEPRGSYQTGINVLNFPKVNLFEKQLRYFLDCINDGNEPDRNTIRESVYLLELIDTIKEKR